MRLATALYVIIGVVNVYAQFTGHLTLNQFTKPVLMPLLIYLVFLKAEGHVSLPRLLLAVALIFAWLGDLLLLNQHDESFFLGGLGSFLLMQILFSRVFYLSAKKSILPSWNLTIPFLIGYLVIGYGAFIYAGPMWFPVTIYALCILTMMLFALNRREQTYLKSFRLTAIGAGLFVISDSLIGINKFMVHIPYAATMIMLTYIPAQYLIMEGILSHEKR